MNIKIAGNVQDLIESLVFVILAVIAQVFLLFVLSWNVVVIVVCIILSVILLITAIVDCLYFSRTVILNADGCTFISFFTTKKFSWENIYLLHTKNSSFFFGDSEFSGEGIILSVKPISKPLHIGAMTYCRFTHPSTSIFIRFTTPIVRTKEACAKFIYAGFVADKEDISHLLQHTKFKDASKAS